jgi:hypothetical protein
MDFTDHDNGLRWLVEGQNIQLKNLVQCAMSGLCASITLILKLTTENKSIFQYSYK